MLQFVPPSVWLDVPSRAQAAPPCSPSWLVWLDSIDAREGMRLFDGLLDVDASGLAMPRLLHDAGVPDGAASLMESARNDQRPCKSTDIRMMFSRPKFARALSHGFQMRSDCVAVIPEGKDWPLPSLAFPLVDALGF